MQSKNHQGFVTAVIDVHAQSGCRCEARIQDFDRHILSMTAFCSQA
jgi:hypothetical protein